MKQTILILAAALLVPVAALHSANAPALRAGAAVVDITPKAFPLNMPGGFSANMAESAHDSLNARAAQARRIRDVARHECRAGGHVRDPHEQPPRDARGVEEG
ncbi:MAG: hypothetical protein ABI318_13685 [Chthoniobacteraceae bacterium]